MYTQKNIKFLYHLPLICFFTQNSHIFYIQTFHMMILYIFITQNSYFFINNLKKDSLRNPE